MMTSDGSDVLAEFTGSSLFPVEAMAEELARYRALLGKVPDGITPETVAKILAHESIRVWAGRDLLYLTTEERAALLSLRKEP
jgi:hypothetical protein